MVFEITDRPSKNPAHFQPPAARMRFGKTAFFPHSPCSLLRACHSNCFALSSPCFPICHAILPLLKRKSLVHVTGGHIRWFAPAIQPGFCAWPQLNSCKSRSGARLCGPAQAGLRQRQMPVFQPALSGASALCLLSRPSKSGTMPTNPASTGRKQPFASGRVFAAGSGRE